MNLWRAARVALPLTFLVIAFAWPLVSVIRVGLDWEKHVEADEAFMRPTEIAASRGDYSKAKADLGWEPKVSFEELVREMVDADVERLS